MAEHGGIRPVRGQREAAPEAIRDGSRRSRAFTVLAPVLLAALLLVASEFATVAAVEVGSSSCEVIQESDPELADRCELSGFERNGGALLALAALGAVMAWGAAIGGSRPAAWALMATGVVVLAWTLSVDLPVTDETGALGRDFEEASAGPGAGFWMELCAGVLLAGAGGLAVTRARVSRRPDGPSPGGQEEAG